MKRAAFLALGSAMFAGTSLLSGGGAFDGFPFSSKKPRTNRHRPHTGRKQREKALKRLEKERKTTTAPGKG